MGRVSRQARVNIQQYENLSAMNLFLSWGLTLFKELPVCNDKIDIAGLPPPPPFVKCMAA
jgi:hypothetical protein